MLSNHKKNLNEKYHVYKEKQDDENHRSPVVLKLKPENQNMPMTPPELRKDVIVENVDKY